MQDHETREKNYEYGLFYGEELLKDAPPKRPLIDGILYENDIVCISAEPGLGKSIMALQIAFNLTTGEPFLETYDVSQPCNVLYVQTEGDRAETVDRIQKMMRGIRLDVGRLYHLNLPGLCLNVTEDMTQFIELIKTTETHYHIIIIDPLYTTIKGSLLSEETATNWHREIRRLRGVYPKVGILVMHHDGKDMVVEGVKTPRGIKDIFGSVFWAAVFNQNYKLSINNGTHVLKLGKMRAGPDKTARSIEVKLIHPSPLLYKMDSLKINETTIKMEIIMRAEPGKKFRRAELEDLLETSKSTAWRALKDLRGLGKISEIMLDNIPHYQWKG